MKPPVECASLSEVRDEIDRIDRQIISLVAQRAVYVRAAARFKTNEEAVAAPKRYAAMLRARREWAERDGLDADLIERIYRELVDYFIARETQDWRRLWEPNA